MLQDLIDAFFAHLLATATKQERLKLLSIAHTANINAEIFYYYNAQEVKFDETSYSVLWTLINQYYTVYGDVPTALAITSEISKNDKLDKAERDNVISVVHKINRLTPESDFEYLCKALIDGLVKNKLHETYNKSLSMAESNVNDSLNFAQFELSNLYSRTSVSNTPSHRSKFLGDFLDCYLEDLLSGEYEKGGISYTFPNFDKGLGKMYPGELIIVCGTPGTGKSTIVNNIGFKNVIQNSLNVVLANKEMLDQQTMVRMISLITCIPMNKLINSSTLTDEEKAYIRETAKDLKAKFEKHLFLIPPSSCDTVTSIKREISINFVDTKPDLIIVDYLNQLEAEDGKLSGAEKIGYVTQKLIDLATYFECPVISPTQPNSEGFKATSPTMDDIGFKVIAAKASTILFCVEDKDNKYVAPMSDDLPGQPGIINCHAVKVRSNSKPNKPLRLSAEFATNTVSDGDIDIISVESVISD